MSKYDEIRDDILRICHRVVYSPETSWRAMADKYEVPKQFVQQIFCDLMDEKRVVGAKVHELNWYCENGITKPDIERLGLEGTGRGRHEKPSQSPLESPPKNV